MNRLKLEVRGVRPTPWGSNEWEWRRRIAQVAREHALDSKRARPEMGSVFNVSLVFRMSAANVGRADLDNLAKPVIDTLFRPRNPQVSDLSLTGALFDVDDDRVFRLTLEKVSVGSELDEGVDITVGWGQRVDSTADDKV